MVLNKRTIKNASEIDVERIVDIALVAVYFNLEAPSLVRSSKRYQISDKVDEDLEKFNYQSIKRAYGFLKRKGLIQVLKEADTLPKITKTGEEKLRRIIPFYDNNRIWDKRIYLVSYDIPMERTRERHYLRNYLRKIGCGMLQQSIWLTPYNPSSLVAEFIKEHNLSEELILVSSIGNNGTVGEMDLTDLMERVYHLSNLNRRYIELIFNMRERKIAKNQVVFGFLSILRDDPQIPFSLLPDDWKGDEAYKLVKNFKSGN